jgi:hypothetical protein
MFKMQFFQLNSSLEYASRFVVAVSISKKWVGQKGPMSKIFNYVSPSNEGRHIVLVWFFLLLLLGEACPLFDLKVKGQGPSKVIMAWYTSPYGHAPTYQISLTYLQRQNCYGPDKKILFKKQLFDLEVKGIFEIVEQVIQAWFGSVYPFHKPLRRLLSVNWPKPGYTSITCSTISY